ncbi:MAG: hypothetical protein QW119_05305 [Candidatus Methanomethylicaceae archaeon]
MNNEVIISISLKNQKQRIKFMRLLKSTIEKNKLSLNSILIKVNIEEIYDELEVDDFIERLSALGLNHIKIVPQKVNI